MSLSRRIHVSLGAVFLALSGVSGAYIRFSHIDMTGARLWVEFWPQYIGIVALAALGYGFVSGAITCHVEK